ncbi:MAG: NAD(P) transhydrogenase subunit alpha [Gemmatimonadales bacterium]|jgi:NAD(P) transhydrogenase subunit alpha|nr:MAG: NAD(P) transhydrogenase subunit alpha [Gemmatimonadales bacterium]
MGEIIIGLYVFVLATLAGREVIGKVPPTLHTPLMSGANAISGIAIIGALLVTQTESSQLRTILGIVAVVMAMINVVGGFMVTDRMLNMFKKHD